MGYKDYKFNGYYHVEKYTGTDPHEHVPHPGWLFYICKGAFRGCETLETIELPEGCVGIKESAFENCVNLQEITLPLSLRTIEKRAFANCRQLQKLHFPRGVYNGQSWPYNDRLYIGDQAFDNCTALADENGFIVIDSMARQHLHPGPHIIVTAGIREFRSDLFYGREDIRTVHLPDSLTMISSRAFSGCKHLETINIPGRVQHIYRDAFQGCEALFPADSDFLILNGWLCGYRGTGSHVVIPEGVAAIADDVFEKHEEIRTVAIPESVTRIGISAFNGCTGLTEVSLPGSLETLEAATFQGCTSLRTVQLPAGLKKISYAAFAKCGTLCDISLPEGLTEIGSQAFLDCTSLPPLKLPDSLLDIAGNALQGTPMPPREDGLIIAAGKVSGYLGTDSEVVIPEGVMEICDFAFRNCSVTGIRFPKTLRHIGDYAFDSCKKLTQVEFREGLATIGRRAFSGCAIREIQFPESLRKIGNYAFHANHIQEVILPRDLGKLGDNAFEDCPVRSISLDNKLLKDHGVRPGEFSKWIDDDIDNNPFPYKAGTLLRTRILFTDGSMDRYQLAEWTEFLHLEDPIIQLWHRSWDEDEPYLNGDDYLPEDSDYHGPNLLSISSAFFQDKLYDWGDYLVIILHRQEIEKLIRADDVTVVKYLAQIGPDILRELISLGEESGAEKVLLLLHELLDNFYIDRKVV